LSKSAENGFGAASRTVLLDGIPRNCPNQITIIARDGLDVNNFDRDVNEAA